MPADTSARDVSGAASDEASGEALGAKLIRAAQDSHLALRRAAQDGPPVWRDLCNALGAERAAMVSDLQLRLDAAGLRSVAAADGALAEAGRLARTLGESLAGSARMTAIAAERTALERFEEVLPDLPPGGPLPTAVVGGHADRIRAGLARLCAAADAA